MGGIPRKGKLFAAFCAEHEHAILRKWRHADAGSIAKHGIELIRMLSDAAIAESRSEMVGLRSLGADFGFAGTSYSRLSAVVRSTAKALSLHGLVPIATRHHLTKSPIVFARPCHIVLI